jgi:membrane protein YqaA with SNARE-associated domain
MIGSLLGSIFGYIIIYKVIHPYIGKPYLERRQRRSEQKQNSRKELE